MQGQGAFNNVAMMMKNTQDAENAALKTIQKIQGSTSQQPTEVKMGASRMSHQYHLRSVKSIKSINDVLLKHSWGVRQKGASNRTGGGTGGGTLTVTPSTSSASKAVPAVPMVTSDPANSFSGHKKAPTCRVTDIKGAGSKHGTVAQINQTTSPDQYSTPPNSQALQLPKQVI